MQTNSYPHHACLDAAGERLFVAAPGLDLSGGPPAFVLALDANTGELLASHELEYPNHNAIPSPDGQEVWTSQGRSPGFVVVLDAETLDEHHRITVGDAPAEVTFDSSGRYALVCNTGSASVTAIDVATRTVAAELTVGMTPVGAWPGHREAVRRQRGGPNALGHRC